MTIDKSELKLLIELLDQMEDLDEEQKTSIMNSYIIADVSSRTIALTMIKDRIDQKVKEKKL